MRKGKSRIAFYNVVRECFWDSRTSIFIVANQSRGEITIRTVYTDQMAMEHDYIDFRGDCPPPEDFRQKSRGHGVLNALASI